MSNDNQEEKIKTQIKMFTDILNTEVGQKHACEDGFGMDEFILETEHIPGMAENLVDWWYEEYPEITLTSEYAKEFLSETYPLTD